MFLMKKAKSDFLINFNLKTQFLILSLLLNIVACDSCNNKQVNKPTVKKPYTENLNTDRLSKIALKPADDVDLSQLAIAEVDSSIQIPLTVENTEWRLLYKETLEKVVIKISNLENVDKIEYTSQRHFDSDSRLSDAECAEIENETTTLEDLLQGCGFKTLGPNQEISLSLYLFPIDNQKEAKCTIELVGSKTLQNKVNVVTKPLILKILSGQDAHLFDLQGELPLYGDRRIKILFQNLKKNDLDQALLESIQVIFSDAKNISNADIYYSIDEDHHSRDIPMNTTYSITLWELIKGLNPQGIVANETGTAVLWMRPENINREARFKIVLVNNEGIIIGKENIVWRP